VDVHKLRSGCGEHGKLTYPYRAFGQGRQLHPLLYILDSQSPIDGVPPPVPACEGLKFPAGPAPPGHADW
jgi:hypothetical protein